MARRRAGYLLLERAACEPGDFDALLAGTLEEFRVHRPFNPLLRWQSGGNPDLPSPGQTVGGLRTVGEPDFWDPEWPAEVRSCPCEGYHWNKSGDRWYKNRYRGPLRPRLFEALVHLEYACHGGDVRSVVSRDPLLTRNDEARYPELALLNDSEAEEVVKDLQRQLAPLLDTLFDDAIFWFSPISWRSASLPISGANQVGGMRAP